MTRYARVGKGSHHRVPKDSTPWNEMKPSAPERVRGADEKGGVKRKFGGGNRKKERFTKNKGGSQDKGSGEDTSRAGLNDSPSRTFSTDHPEGKADRGFKKSKNENIRGFGQSKSMKIFGQFWVPLEDAKRLKNLVRKLKSQGLPRKEILEALKNERRRAEKAAKRQRDKTCFQCRQFGHILSDCPNLKKAIAGESLEGAEEIASEGVSDQGLICFKCGSTEHMSRNCRRKGEKFEFAKCFICSGSGHIARQCPQNSNGIYPSGGSCSECGSAAHLKKDCPDLIGMEQSDDKEDKDAMTLQVADPFSSTEYEPVFDFEEENIEDEKKSNEESTLELKSEDKITLTKTGKRKGKRKVMDSQVEPKSECYSPVKTLKTLPSMNKPLFASTKRKVVKF